MEEIPKIKPGELDPPEVDARTGERVKDLGEIVKYLLATSPLVRAQNITALARELGLKTSTVRQWYREGTSPNLDNLARICARIGTDPVQFLLQWEGFSNTLAQRHGAVFDRIAAVLAKPENAHKLLAILLEEQKLGILDSYLDQKAAELGVDPDHPVRSIGRPPAGAKKKSRKGA